MQQTEELYVRAFLDNVVDGTEQTNGESTERSESLYEPQRRPENNFDSNRSNVQANQESF